MSDPCPRDWEQCDRSYCQRKKSCAERDKSAPAERNTMNEPLALRWRTPEQAVIEALEEEVRALRAALTAQAAPDVNGALQESSYLAGVRYGFQLGQADDEAGLAAVHRSREGYLKPIKDAVASRSLVSSSATASDTGTGEAA